MAETWPEERLSIIGRLKMNERDVERLEAQYPEAMARVVESEKSLIRHFADMRTWQAEASTTLLRELTEKVAWLDERNQVRLDRFASEITNQISLQDGKIALACAQIDQARERITLVERAMAVLGVKISPATALVTALIALLTAGGAIALKLLG